MVKVVNSNPSIARLPLLNLSARPLILSCSTVMSHVQWMTLTLIYSEVGLFLIHSSTVISLSELQWIQSFGSTPWIGVGKGYTAASQKN